MSTATTSRATTSFGTFGTAGATGAGAASRARHFTGAALKEIAFPLGGIGTGTISLGGRGQLRDWEIFNRPAKGCDLPLCFFSIWTRPEGGDAVARILERRLLPPFVADRGLSPWAVASLPRLEEATFVGTYPTATIRFHDSSLPVEAELEAFTPFVPLDDRVSGLPVAVFLWRLRNPSSRAVDVTLAYTQMNPVGYDGVAVLPRGRRHAMFGGNVNQWTDEHADPRAPHEPARLRSRRIPARARWRSRRRGRTSRSPSTGSGAAGSTTSRTSGTTSAPTAGCRTAPRGRRARPGRRTRARSVSARGSGRGRRSSCRSSSPGTSRAW